MSIPSPRATAVLLAVFVPLAVTPAAIVDQLWLGPAMIGAGIGTDGVFAALGVATLVGGAIPIVLLALVPAVARGSRTAALGAIAGVALTLLVVGGPLHEVSPTSWIPLGRALLIVWGLAALTALIGLARSGAAVTRGPRRELSWAGGLLAVALVAGAAATASNDRIPTPPTDLLLADFEGGERLTAAPLEIAPVRYSGGLKPGQGSNIHNDAAMTDTYTGRSLRDPGEAEVATFRAPGDCASILFDRGGRLIAVCVGGTRVMAYVLDPATLEPLAERRLADRDVGTDLLTNFAGGGYAVLDGAGRLLLGTSEGTIDRYRIADRDGGDVEIVAADEFDVSASLGSGEPITSALPEVGGRIWYVGAEGTVGVLDPRSGRSESVRFSDTDIENSFALAPGGGAFVVTSRSLLRLGVDRRGAPTVVWEEPYDDGERLKPGQSSRASGTTPTVMSGGRFVAITDNAEPRMNVLVYDARPRARGDRLVCAVPVFADGESATENSLIAAGDALFVENNYGYRLLDVLGGHSSEPGMARIDLDPAAGTCETAWENDEIRIPSVVSKVAVADGTVLTYTKPERPSGIDSWYFTALDAGTGEVLWKRLAGVGSLVNNHYAALYLGPDGRLYVGTAGGVVGLV